MINHGQKVHKIQMNIVDCNEFKEDHFFNYLLGNNIHEELVADLKGYENEKSLNRFLVHDDATDHVSIPRSMRFN